MAEEPSSNGQTPDASDTFDDQAENLPIENIKAPVERAPAARPEIPKENAEAAEAAKDDITSDEKDT